MTNWEENNKRYEEWLQKAEAKLAATPSTGFKDSAREMYVHMMNVPGGVQIASMTNIDGKTVCDTAIIDKPLAELREDFDLVCSAALYRLHRTNVSHT